MNLFSSISLLGFITFTSLAAPVVAQEATLNFRDKNSQYNKNNKSVVNSNYGLPVYRRDGGSRGNCTAGTNNLVALVPEHSIGLTASTSPELFFYIPKQDRQKDIEFVLRDEKDSLVYETFLESKREGGIMSVQIPDTGANTLKSNQNYRWYLSLICNHQKRSHDLVLEGQIRYVDLDRSIREKLNVSNNLKKAEIYSQAGAWYDSLSVLAEQKAIDNNNPTISNKWSEILKSVGLENLASEKIITK